jgi:4-amino-4-deoxy-L-arabinose transferase-like glycosyltransferase
MILAVVCCFYHLSEGTLCGDEAAFACTTDRMRATGDWVVPFITDTPHMNATPLYNWLTLALAPWSDETPLRYRFWSATFGVGCVLSAFALGTFLFRAEVGLLAGLFLALNRDFLFCHGIRFGGMDAMLAFFITAATFCYAWIQTRPARAWTAWGLLGVCIGLAWLSKPPVFGCFFLAGISLHHLCARRGEPWPARVAGPLFAFTAGVVIAVPWYLLMWLRLGNPFLQELFVHNSVERALDPSLRDFFCCHRSFWHASYSFKLMELALACAVACWLVNHRRPQVGLLLFLTGGYLCALTAAGKSFQYVYYAFPSLSVVLACLLLDFGPRLAVWSWPQVGVRRASLIGAGFAAVLVGADAVRALRTLASPPWVHPPVGIYERLARELEQGRCHFVLFNFHSLKEFNVEDLYYCPRLPLADRVQDVAGLRSLLEDNKPTIVLLPPGAGPQPQLAALRPEVWVQENNRPLYTYPVFTFHGATTKVTVAELVRLARGEGSR